VKNFFSAGLSNRTKVKRRSQAGKTGKQVEAEVEVEIKVKVRGYQHQGQGIGWLTELLCAVAQLP